MTNIACTCTPYFKAWGGKEKKMVDKLIIAIDIGSTFIRLVMEWLHNIGCTEIIFHASCIYKYKRFFILMPEVGVGVLIMATSGHKTTTFPSQPSLSSKYNHF